MVKEHILKYEINIPEEYEKEGDQIFSDEVNSKKQISTEYEKLVNYLFKIVENDKSWKIDRWEIRKKDISEIEKIFDDIDEISPDTIELLNTYKKELECEILGIDIVFNQYNEAVNLLKKKNDEYYQAKDHESVLKNEENDLQLEADQLFNDWYSTKHGYRKDEWNEYIRKKKETENKNAEYLREMKRVANIRTQIENIKGMKNEKIIRYNELSSNLRQTISEILDLYISLSEN